MVSKIVDLKHLSGVGGILLHGCYDILHIGHVRQIKQARALSKELPLIVTLTADRFIRKGPGRPAFQADIRAEVLEAMEDVDFVAIVEEATGLSAIDTIKPAYYVKGVEYECRGGIAELERIAVESYGGKMVYTERWSSSSALFERVMHALAAGPCD